MTAQLDVPVSASTRSQPGTRTRYSLPDARFVVMAYGHKLIDRRHPRPAFFPEVWSPESVSYVTGLMTEGSVFVTYIYKEYEELVRFAQLNALDTWAQHRVGSIVILGPYNTERGSAEQEIIKLSDQPNSVYLLSQDYLVSFGPKPQREVPLDGALRFHKMWVTTFLDIGSIFFLHDEITDPFDDAQQAGQLINQISFADILAQGFSSLFFEKVVLVRDRKPAAQHLQDPEVRVFSADK